MSITDVDRRKVTAIKLISLPRYFVADGFLRSAGTQDRKSSHIKDDREVRNTSSRMPSWAIAVTRLPEIDGVAA